MLKIKNLNSGINTQMQIESSNSHNINYSKTAHLNSHDTNSLTLVLVQALESNDNDTLKFIIEQENVEIINTTLDKFENEKLYTKFVQHLISRLKSFPKETTNVLRWLDIFLKKKGTFIHKNSTILEELKSAKSLFTVKEKLYSNLLRIKGKLAFLIEARKSVQDPDRFLTGSFGTPKIIIDERDIIKSSNGAVRDADHLEIEDENDEDLSDEENIYEEDEGQLDEDQEELLYEEEYENEQQENDDEDVDMDEVHKMGMELQDEIESDEENVKPTSKKDKYLKLQNQAKKATKKR